MRKNVLVFGVGELQKSLIERAHRKGLFVVGIDPLNDAFCKKDVDAFEIVDGQDFEGTLAVARKYSIDAIVTTATDKPLVMMARVAKELDLPFFSRETAECSTDKYQMKQLFLQNDIPCAKGQLIKSVNDIEGFDFPVIVKPRDNSGSRGVKLCYSKNELECCIEEALRYSYKDSVLVEEYIEGQEYSIESLHFNGNTYVIQFTEKRTTPFPYNVELGHKQPANLSDVEKDTIRDIIIKVGDALKFDNCPSHTEIKINNKGIYVIETSPRLGGDFITSTLVPLSTGINLEDQLLNIALGDTVELPQGIENNASGVCFLSLPEGRVKNIDDEINNIRHFENIVDFNLKLSKGDIVNKITSSLNRYGHFVVKGTSRREIDSLMEKYELFINSKIEIQ